MENIKAILIASVFMLWSVNVISQSFNRKELKKIHNFLIDFGDAVDKADTLKVKDYIFDYDYQGTNNQDYAIERLFGDQQVTGMDFEYSKKAFSQIVDSLYNKFTPITSEIRKVFYVPIEAKNVLDTYEDLQVGVLNYKKTLIVLILDKKKIQLFFSEGINRLTIE